MSDELQAAVEAIVYAADEPATVTQMAKVLSVEAPAIEAALERLRQRYAGDEFGIEVKPVGGGYRMATKAQHHEAVRLFIKSLRPPLRLSLAALETLAVIAYRQPITLPEIRDLRGVDPAGVINTLLEKKLISTAGRKEVVGKPILYRTTREFLLQFGLAGLGELPTLKEFEELARAGIEGLAPEAAPAENPEKSAENAAGEAAADQSS